MLVRFTVGGGVSFEDAGKFDEYEHSTPSSLQKYCRYRTCISGTSGKNQEGLRWVAKVRSDQEMLGTTMVAL